MHTFWQSAIALATGVAPGPMGSAHPLNAPYEAFATKDGYINLGAANQATWLRTIELLNRADLGEDPRFKEAAGRLVHREALAAELAVEFKKRTSAEWLTALEQAKVPAGPVLNVLQMHADEQTVARDMVLEVNHTRIGAMKTLGAPVKFSATPGGVRRGAPIFGEHTAEVLREHGFNRDDVKGMTASGAIFCA